MVLLALLPNIVTAQGRRGVAKKAFAPRPPVEAALQSGVTVGSGETFGRLTVFPIYSVVQRDAGEFVSLEQALRAKTAEVREKSDGASVNELTIENKGKTNILVLAGTVIKGGNQDRQIGQDFIISAKKTVPIDAFCVEHGRWEGSREGQATGGKFQVVSGLAPTTVRAAGQYKENQAQVWDAVAKVNAENRSSSESGTLIATLDNPRIIAQRKTLARKIKSFLDARTPQKNLVGLAWAIDGEVRAVRWFMNHKIWTMYQGALGDVAALEALTTKKHGKPKSVGPQAIVAFVKEIDRAKSESKATAAGNVNEYRKAAKGGSSRAMAPAAPASSTSPKKPADALTHDYSAY